MINLMSRGKGEISGMECNTNEKKDTRKSAQQRASENDVHRVVGDWTRGGEIKDSRVCFAVFVRAALDANPQAGILGGGTQLGNNRCQ